MRPFKQSGIGLVEVMVAAAMLGGLSLVVMQLTENSQKTVVRMEKGAEAVELDGEINALLSNKKNCTATINDGTTADLNGTPRAISLFTGNAQWAITRIKAVVEDTSGNEVVRDVYPIVFRRNLLTLEEVYLTGYGNSDLPPGTARLVKKYRFNLGPNNTAVKTKSSTVSIVPVPNSSSVEACVLKSAESESIWRVDDFGIAWPETGTVAIGTNADTALPYELNVLGEIMVSPEVSPNSIIGNNNRNNNIIGGRGNMIEGDALDNIILGGNSSQITDPDTLNSGVFVGINNTSHGRNAVIVGGSFNEVFTTSGNSSIVGGAHSQARENASTVLGGLRNSAAADQSLVAGGRLNSALSLGSFVGGGVLNSAAGPYSVVLGGEQNRAEAAGSNNATDSIVLGGTRNTVSGDYAGIVSGSQNRVSADESVIVGGEFNTVSREHSGILGGFRNTISNTNSAIVGGELHTVTQPFGAVVGGSDNNVLNYFAVALGGQLNTAGGLGSSTLGGDTLQARGERSAAVGGERNWAHANDSMVLGGRFNSVGGQYGVALGGQSNFVRGLRSLVLGGFESTLGTTGEGSAIIAGARHNVIGGRSVIVGGLENQINTDTSFDSFMGGGWQNIVSGLRNSILGGASNSISGGANSAILGGYRNSISNVNGGVILNGHENLIDNTAVSDNSNTVILGGQNNQASGIITLVHGVRVKANFNAVHGTTTFTDADGAAPVLNANISHRFLARFANGYRLCTNSTCTTGMELLSGTSLWTEIPTTSDRNLKKDVRRIDEDEVLKRLSELDVTTWVYKNANRPERHIGPMAQDFNNLFAKFLKLRSNETTIQHQDLTGVALVGIKALEKRSKELMQENNALRSELMEMRKEMKEMRRQIGEIKKSGK